MNPFIFASAPPPPPPAPAYWDATTSYSAHIISNGGLDVSTRYAGSFGRTKADTHIPNGQKGYFELEALGYTAPFNYYGGVAALAGFSGTTYSDTWFFYAAGSGELNQYYPGTTFSLVTASPAWSVPVSVGGRFCIWVDTVAGTVNVQINRTGTTLTMTSAGLQQDIVPIVGTPASSGSANADYRIHASSTSCTYAPPSGFSYLDDL